MKLKPSIRFALAVGLLMAAAAAFAQPDLILKTEPEETPISLGGNVGIDSNGNIVVVPADTGLVCSSGALCDDVAVSTRSFTVNGAEEVSVSQGEKLLFEWDSRGAWECQGLDFPGWEGTGKPPHSNGVSVDTSEVEIGTHEPSLICLNGSIEGEKLTAIVHVEEADEEPSHCSDRAQLSGNWEQRTFGSNSCIYKDNHGGIDTDKDCRFFDGIWPEGWPGTSNTRVLNLGPGSGGREYVAIQFNSGNLASDDQLQTDFNEPQTGNLEMVKAMRSVSTCPGDFDQQAVEEEMGPGCYKKHEKSGRFNIYWGGSDYIDNTNVCGLQPNTDYYLNILYTGSSGGTPPSDIEPNSICADGNGCGHRMTGG